MTDEAHSTTPGGFYGPGQGPQPYAQPFDPYATGGAPDGQSAGFWAAQQGPPAAPPQPAPPAPQPPAGEPDAEGVAPEDDFDAWLAQHAREQPQTRILGQVVPIPFDIPLKITSQIENGGDMTVATMRGLVREIYGEQIERAWWERGVGNFGLGVILAWTVMRARGERVGFSEAVEKATELGKKVEAEKAARAQTNAQLSAAAAAGQGDSPEARAHREALEAMTDAGKAPSPGTGAPWSPTSGGSTGSPLPGWRT